MDPEFLQLAREAVAALQAPREPSWTDIAGVVVGFLQCGVIAWGLWRWGKDIDARRRVLDERVAAWEREEGRRCYAPPPRPSYPPPRAICYNAAPARSLAGRAKEADSPRPLPFARSRSSRIQQIWTPVFQGKGRKEG